VWVAGAFYPPFIVSTVTGAQMALQLIGAGAGDGALRWDVQNFVSVQAVGLGPPDAFLGLAGSIALLPVLLPIFRLIAGLARIASPATWDALSGPRGRPRLRDAWRAGAGLTLSSAGLWLQMVLMMFGTALLAAGPFRLLLELFGAREPGALAYVVFAPVLGVLALYGVVLFVLYQLALHSLAQNGRGVASALVHAWRLMRNDPWATARASLVDFVLFVSGLAIFVIAGIGMCMTCALAPFIPLIGPVLNGFLGVTRAIYWGRAYRALGGLSPDDGIPGLVPQQKGAGG
jgi:hypothetical protein